MFKLKKNYVIIVGVILFLILYKYGNNMEFYTEPNSNSKKVGSRPELIKKAKGPLLDPTDDIVLERKDLKQLNREKIGKFNYDGLDNWPAKGQQKGWWNDNISAGKGLYHPPNKMLWPD